MSWETATVEPVADGAADGGADAWGTDGGAENGGVADGDAFAGGEAAEPKVQLTKEEALTKARDAGWTATTAFNYAEFERTGGHDRDWLGAAQKYEWNDEFGEVAPRVEALENILFGGEFQMRRGEHIGNLEIEANIEGPVKIARVEKVRLLLKTLLASTDIDHSSRMPDSTLCFSTTFSLHATLHRQ